MFFVTVTRRCDTAEEAERFADKRTMPGDTVTITEADQINLVDSRTGQVEKTIEAEGFSDAFSQALAHLGYTLEFVNGNGDVV